MKALTQAKALTMTSREIAELVEARHDNVKRTIETLAEKGIIESPQIEEIRTSTNKGSVYVFTGEQGKRDSIIIVAQLSSEFTARLVDRWQELENQAHHPQAKAIRPQTPLKQLSEATKAFKDVYHLLRVLDVDKNAAAIRANQAVRQQGNLDVLALTGSGQLKAENQDSPHYNPTELGERIGLNARQVNQALAAAGLQSKQGKRWIPTAEGRPHAYIVDVEKSHHSGAPIQQVRWYESVLSIIERVISQKEAA